MTIYGDSHFYSSYMLNDFLDGRIDPPRALERCSEHRAGTLLDDNTARAVLNCGSMIAGLALWRGRYDRAFKWLEHLHWLRRRPGTPTPLSMETGQLHGGIAEGTQGSEWKLRHDAEQFRYLAKQPFRQQVSPYAPLANPEAAASLAEAASQLLEEMKKHSGAGGGDASGTLPVLAEGGRLAALTPYLDRAVHVPHVERIESGALNRNANWGKLASSFKRDGIAYIDNALTEKALNAVTDHFLEATVWYTAHAGGAYLKANILDGLHAELILQMGAELAKLLPDVLGPHRLSSIYAHKYDTEWPGSPGLGTHTLPAEVVVALWTTPSSANRLASGNGFEVFEAAAPASFSATDRYAWLPRLEEDATKYNILKADGFRSKKFAYKVNRLMVWQADRFFRTDWDPRKWRAGYRHNRVDLWFLYGSPPKI
eukprot:TRINITY_DN17993_c0_g1_i1.p1 TRINITY_DN17993_c0_g1~~TRINITY_DN17993_c0_g1_i1.p1  ORF type:complete len:427 (+),score=80.28 TRINITY_DN17993_c0_g1_i1:2-1282(+)